ncbi:MAG: DpnII family type II restriction endonuclease [bacterium]
MKNIKPTTELKFRTVIDKNTFYFFNPAFEEKYEGYLNSLKEILLFLKNEIENKGLKKEIFENLLVEKENGLRALLALTGFSNETLKRLTTIIRVVDDSELSKLVYKEKWFRDGDVNNIKEWSNGQIAKLIRDNKYFRKGIVNIFFEGSTIPFLTKTVPLFELKKISISKLKFELPEMIDTLIRYKEKGSYSAMKENNPEILIEEILNHLGIPFEKGDLSELIDNAPDNKRTMDFIIPNKKNPLIIVESSFLATTSSGQGDKSKTEISIDALIKSHYPKAKFVGFVDGIGWYVRKGDLKRMVNAYEEVFTFHKEELKRFEKLLIDTFLNK